MLMLRVRALDPSAYSATPSSATPTPQEPFLQRIPTKQCCRTAPSPMCIARKKHLEKIKWPPGQFRVVGDSTLALSELGHRPLKLLWTLPRPEELLRGHAA